MNCFVWNARGLGNPGAFRELRRIVAKSNPTLLFICETKLHNYQFSTWRNYLHYKGLFSVDCEGRKGGLVLLWNDPYEVTTSSFSPGHIDCIVTHEQKVWRFTGFYGSLVSSLRHVSWKLLSRLYHIHEFHHLPWLVGGN